MKVKSRHTNKIIMALAFFVVSMLIFSFGLHSIQIPHDHQDHYTTHANEKGHVGEFERLSSYMHVAEKKLIAMASQLLLLCASAALILFGSWSILMLYQSRRLYIGFKALSERFCVLRDYLSWCFSQGLLNPKLY